MVHCSGDQSPPSHPSASTHDRSDAASGFTLRAPAEASHDGLVLTKLDAHCHSKASSGPAVKALGLIGCPESYTEPERAFDLAMARGMDLFTLTDHDTIDGALHLVERGFPRIVIGEEVTVFFPEDRCKLHVLVWMLTPELHEEIAARNLRSDVYEFAAWLHARQLPHALAHPLYIQNRKLTRTHLDRCALLFKGFETLNGAHAGTHRDALEHYLRSLTPGKVHRMIREQGLEPFWPRIWEKARTGGSDDHGLLNVGRTCTQVAAPHKLTDPKEFFRRVMNGQCDAAGAAGHSSLLAHQLASVGMHFCARRLFPKAGAALRYAAADAFAFAGIEVRKPSRFAAGLSLVRSKIRRTLHRRPGPLSPLEAVLRSTVRDTIAMYPDLAARLRNTGGLEGAAIGEHERAAAFADDLFASLHRALESGAARALRTRDRHEIGRHLASYAALTAAQLPYLFSLFHQNKERALVDQVLHESVEPGRGLSPLERPLKVMLFTDTLGDVNGVSRFIRNTADMALASGRDLRVVTSTRMAVPDQPNIINFEPVFAMKMPKYEQLELALPPLVRMLRYADQVQPDVIHVSTPGSVGLVGLIASRMLRIPVAGTYHTDFPAYVEHLFQDDGLTAFCRTMMSAFYKPFAALFSRSEEYKGAMKALGIDERRWSGSAPASSPRSSRPSGATHPSSARATAPRPCACSTSPRQRREEPAHAHPHLESRPAAPREHGRRGRTRRRRRRPYRAEMQEELASTRARFMGFRYGEELSRIYASCDAFLFPSLTDTLGQVVMEAQSSGLPVVVADQGGPKEVVEDGRTGFVLSGDDLEEWVKKVIQLSTEPALRSRMRRRPPLHAGLLHGEELRAFLGRARASAARRPRGKGHHQPAPPRAPRARDGRRGLIRLQRNPPRPHPPIFRSSSEPLVRGPALRRPHAHDLPRQIQVGRTRDLDVARVTLHHHHAPPQPLHQPGVVGDRPGLRRGGDVPILVRREQHLARKHLRRLHHHQPGAIDLPADVPQPRPIRGRQPQNRRRGVRLIQRLIGLHNPLQRIHHFHRRNRGVMPPRGAKDPVE